MSQDVVDMLIVWGVGAIVFVLLVLAHASERER